MWFALLACQPSGSGTVPDGVTASGDDDDDDDVTTDTGTPVEEVVAPEVTTVTHALHPEFGTVVVVSWRQNTRADVHLEFTVDGAPRRSPARDLPAGDHEELLLGLPYDADTHVPRGRRERRGRGDVPRPPPPGPARTRRACPCRSR
jgi:hypothetical protein